MLVDDDEHSINISKITVENGGDNGGDHDGGSDDGGDQVVDDGVEPVEKKIRWRWRS